MNHLLKKLHVVQDQSSETSTSAADLSQRSEHKRLPAVQGWLSSIAAKNPFTTTTAAASSTGSPLGADMDGNGLGARPQPAGDAAESRRNLPAVEEDEEYQVQLAIELSAREDPEAVKQISLGSCSPQNSPAEVLAYRYRNYNALSFDDKILDGFYDLYGVLAESPTTKMPSLVDLQRTPASNGIFWEAVLVNRRGDPDLLKLEQKALVMALESKSESLGHAGGLLVQKLAALVADYMGGAVDDSNNLLKAWQSHSNGLRMSVGTIVLPLGCLTVGLARHRALLFKVLADSVGVPCQLLKGKPYTSSDDGSMNIVRLNDGREWIVDLMLYPGTLLSSDAVGTQRGQDDDIFALSPSIGDSENLHVISCSSSASSTISCSSSNETLDKRSSFGHTVTSESDISTLGESRDEDNRKISSFSKESSTELSKEKSRINNNLMNFCNQNARLYELSLKPTHSHALARSPSWTEGISSPAAHRMKVKDVSQYMIDATKENPLLAQKLHDVLLESGVAVPPNLFTEICMEHKKTSIPEGRRFSDHKNETKREVEMNRGSPKPSLPCPPDQVVHQKVVPSRSHIDPLNPVVGLGVQHPLDIVPCSSQSEEHPVQQQASPIKFIDNMPVATAALVASSVVVAETKSNSQKSIDVPVAAAARATTAAVVATTAAVSVQRKQILSYAPLPAISIYNNNEVVQSKSGKEPVKDEQKGSHSAQEGVLDRKHEISKAHHEAERSLDKTKGAGKVKSVVQLENVAEFEIPWEEIILGERIGLGSYGEVYRGVWHGTEVAVKKILEQDLSGDALEEFKTEVRIMKRLRHPNVVLFMGAVTHAPHLSIVTEFLPRGSLFRLIHRPNNQLDERRCLKMALDVARGMNYLHSCCPVIVHRDLKSPNLLVDKNWVVKVCDFGLSRIKHNTFLSSRSTAGTAEWMAPEVLRNEPSDEKCDVYSFGVILWELCTLQQPWGGMNAMQVVGAVGFQHRCLDIPNDMDPAIADIILRCWQTDPAKRPSFAEIMAELKPLQKPVANLPACSKAKNHVNSLGKFL